MTYNCINKTLFFLILITGINIYSQQPTLEYIFQDTQIVNPRPTLKFIDTKSNKIYCYADDDYDGSMSLFSFNYALSEYYKFPDSVFNGSEFRVLANGDALFIDHGNIFISKDFVTTNLFSKDVQLTNSEDYLYSPEVAGKYVIFRKKGNYYITTVNSKPGKETKLTTDESDTISNQVIAISDIKEKQNNFRILLAKYDNSSKRTVIFPDYSDDFVTISKEKKGISNVTYAEYNLRYDSGKDSILYVTNEIKYPDLPEDYSKNERYTTDYALYSEDSKHLILDVETMDRHHRKIFNYDVQSGKMKEIFRNDDTAWFERHGNATRFIDNDRIIFESENPGYNNLYIMEIDASDCFEVASGNYTVLESVIDRTNKKIYFIANIEKPTAYNIYATDFIGTEPQKLTTLDGDYSDLRISGDGEYLFYSHSYITTPNELYCYNISTGHETQITNTISPKFAAIQWKIPEEITFNNKEDNELIHAFLYKPDNFDKRKKYPLICFAHGSGYLQNVTWGYSPYGDNFMVNTFLTNNGYLVLDVDFRGSLGYGKNFRNKTYRNLGYWEVLDYISGIDYLDGLGYIDREKVGIYGGSYGGFVTMMATFRHPEYFKTGVVLRGVSDWANYLYGNWWFTLARFGELNDENKIYYDISSPITYADNLQVPLLITHGMLDDNVYFTQDVHLVQKLIGLHKNFEVMYYPKEFHEFHIQADWLDLYKRIFNFFEMYIK